MTVVPIGWTSQRLLDLVVIRSGQVNPRQPQYRDMPLIAPDHIEVGTGRLLAVRSAHEQGAISGKYIVEPGDVIYSKIRPYLTKAHLAQFPALCSADMYALKPCDGVDGRYVVNVLLGRRFTNFAVGESMRSGIPKINRESLAGYELPVPAPSEQRAIGDVLSDADGLILALEKLIAKKHDVKQGLMQELLTGHTRLPGFTEDWRMQQLGEVTTIDPDSLSLVATPRIEEIDYIALEDVSRGVILGSTRIEFGVAPSRARRGVRVGDVLFGTVRPNLQSHCIYRGGLGNPVASTGFAVIRYRSGVTDSSFLAQWVLSDVVMSQVDRIIAGSNYPAVSSADVRAFEIDLPMIEEQRAIGLVLADADAEIEVLKRRLESARAVKVGMMQELLTGRTRLLMGMEA